MTLLTLLPLLPFLLFLLVLEVDPISRLASRFLFLVDVVDKHLQRKDRILWIGGMKLACCRV